MEDPQAPNPNQESVYNEDTGMFVFVPWRVEPNTGVKAMTPDEITGRWVMQVHESVLKTTHYIEITNVVMSDTVATQLNAVIQQNTVLEYFSFVTVKISDAVGAVAIIGGLSNIPTLRYLLWSSSAYGNFRNAEANSLGQLLTADHCQLRVLLFWGRPDLDNFGSFTSIAVALRNNTSLRSLTLSLDGFNDTHAQAYVAAVRDHNQTLEEFSPYGGVGHPGLAQALEPYLARNRSYNEILERSRRLLSSEETPSALLPSVLRQLQAAPDGAGCAVCATFLFSFVREQQEARGNKRKRERAMELD